MSGLVCYILRVLLFILSLMGYALYLETRHQVAYGFGLAIGAGFIISVLWLTGLIFPITGAIWALWGLGLLLLVLSVRKARRPLLNATNLFLFPAAALAFIILLGRRLTFVDDFNHWGTMARSVLEHQALPDAGDPLISFVSYPPGAALWIADFMTVTGSTSEDMYLFAQALLALLFFCPLTVSLCTGEGVGRGKRLFQGFMLLAIFLLAASTLSFASTMLSLCVDGLLAAAGVGLMCFVLCFHGSSEKKILFSLPLILAVISVKDTGKFFAAFAVVALAYDVIRSGRGSRRSLLLSLAPVAAAFGISFLWQGYVNRAFPQAASAPHSLNLSRLEAVFQSRSAEELEIISGLFIREVFHVRTTLPLLLFLTVLLAVFWLRRLTGDAEQRKTAALAAFLCAHYLLYLLGLAFVYFYSMEIEGALVLQSYTRYLGTEVCFIFGVCLGHLAEYIFSSEEMPSVKGGLTGILNRYRRHVCMLACMGMMSALAWFYCGNFSFDNAFIGSSRERILQLSGGGYSGDAAVYVPAEEDLQYKKWIRETQIMYDFRSADISVVEGGDEEALHTALAAHSRLLIYDVDETLTDCLLSRGWQNEIAPGLYSLENAGLS